MITWEYLAGLFDGEGWISLHYNNQRKRKYARIQIGMTDKNVIEQCCEFLGTNLNVEIKKNPRYKPLYKFHIGGVKAKNIIDNLYPFLIVKKKQAKEIIDFYEQA